MYFTQLMDAVHWIQWKPVFILTICLMAFYTLFFQEGQPAVSLSESDLTPSPRISKPNALPLPEIFDNYDPLIVEGPEDHIFPPDAAPNPYIAVCMAVKNQGPELREFFVHHYHHIGIRRFYIMDDGSDPPLYTFEYPGIPRSALSFVLQDPTNRASRVADGRFEQLAIYARCIEDYRSLHTWMAFIDNDEFFEMTSNDTLREILEAFEGNDTVGALAVNWRMHSSSGLLKQPESARKSFVNCITDEPDDTGTSSYNTHVKVIVRTASALSPIGPHMWNLKQGNTVGENGDIVESEAWRDPITRDRIALHHYGIKSREEFEDKMHRGNAMDDPRGESYWETMENVYHHVDCPEMAKYDP